MTKEQIRAFNDAVIAIIITLMVLDIKLPELNSAGILTMTRHILVYALSFFTIGIGWINMQLLFAKVRHVSANLIWVDLLLLFFLSLIPLPTQALGERFFDPASHAFFGLIQALVSVAFKLLIDTIESGNPVKKVYESVLTRRLDVATILLYVGSMALCYVSVYLSTLLFLVPVVIYYSRSRQQIKSQSDIGDE